MTVRTMALLVSTIFFSAHLNAHHDSSANDDQLSMTTDTAQAPRTVIQGLLEVDNLGNTYSQHNATEIQKAMNVYRPSLGDTNNIQFPCGTYYIGHQIQIDSHTTRDWKLTVKIPACTTLVATHEIKNQALFNIRSPDLSFDLGQLCFYGGESCSRIDTTVGGIIDTSNMTNDNGSHPFFTNNNSIWVHNLNTLIVQGIQFIGAKEHSDTFITGKVRDASVRFNEMISTSDAAVYFNGQKDVNGNELSHEAFIWSNLITDTATGVVCKREAKSCIVEDNVFEFNNSSIGCTATGDTNSPFPCQRMIAIGNTITGNMPPLGTWSQGIIFDWCNNGCIAKDNFINGHIGQGFPDQMPDCDVRIFNSSNVVVMDNFKNASKVFQSKHCPEGSVLRPYGNMNLSNPSNDNTITITAPRFPLFEPPIPHGDDFPIIHVNNTREGDQVMLWSDAACTTALTTTPVTALAGEYSVDVVPDLLSYGYYDIRATISRDMAESICSNAYPYYVDTIRPPNGLSILTSSGNASPTVTISGVKKGDQISLWKNAACTIPAATYNVISQGGSVDIVPDLLLVGSSYTLRAQIERSGKKSACSSVSAAYQVTSP